MGFPTPPRGLVADLITPLHEDGTIDDQGVKRVLSRVCPHVEGVLLAGPHGGEGRALPASLRAHLLKTVLAQTARNFPVLVWITQATEEGTRDNLAALLGVLKGSEAAARVFLVDTPLYYHSNRGLLAHYAALCSLSPCPFLICNDPGLLEGTGRPFKRKNIRTAILKSLTGLTGLQGMIFLGDLDRARNYEQARQGNPDFVIYDGDESHFLQFPSMGGVVSLGANLNPWAWGKITRSSLQKTARQNVYPDHLAQIWDLGHHLNALREVYNRAPIPIIKGALAEMGVIESPYCLWPARECKEEIQQIMGLLSSCPQP